MINELSKIEARNILNADLNTFLDFIKEINHNRSNEITFSKNIFLPLTHICQNNCGYCTFKQDVDEAEYLVMNKETVLNMVQKAKKVKCTEALFAFGESSDKNDYVKNELEKYGFESMVDYVYYLSERILLDNEMLPHTNMGIISRSDLRYLSEVNASMGLMLETTNKKLLKTIVHKDSPGKNPDKRINFIKNAGKENIPFTTGLLIGIGETTDDHIDSLFALRDLQDKYGHIQEIIIQNFKPKSNIPMKDHPEPSLIDLLKLTVLATVMFPDVSIQIPPNLNHDWMSFFILCGADDMGGISPLTKDYVNPENDWPSVNDLSSTLSKINFSLKERLPVYEKYINDKYLKEKVYDTVIKLQNEIN
ncbi:7,8-didemethyl-8-hydroxy-5-deazariboflavin synthase subunit CofG [Methanosphaera sp.]|uniref:7,8-didemethyl-8-hydroxy-5-deazariboflavin synthase subunit CofG n=1 Tax=Methanosphaera sp. TaxID=2666342 RepID=UPI002E787907|nr:7,8-didemethyl-8-hydroxy-5-deazariboflavin synthase subunit CofG [Methanosphaera sp.]MEE1118285.1 7,8-didemethyl-8-hydroxy-5-deazariboflavin synthase subunit CofG [Methanosphaera sp.]